MSNFGHYVQQYNGSIKFPPESFKIRGISKYKFDVESINLGSTFEMVTEPTNKYDSGAIKILYNNEIIGYVPKSHQSICRDCIDDELKTIYYATLPEPHQLGIRVIPERFYTNENYMFAKK